MQACLPFNLIQPIEVRLTHSDHAVGSPVSTALVHLTRTQMAIRELTKRSGNSRANTIVQIFQKKNSLHLTFARSQQLLVCGASPFNGSSIVAEISMLNVAHLRNMSPASAKGISMDAAAAAACRTGWHIAHFTLTQGGSESFSQWKICLWYEFDWTQAQVASSYGCLLISFAYSRLVVNLIFLSWTLSCYLYKRTRTGRSLHLNGFLKLLPPLHRACKRAASHWYVSGRAMRGRRNVQ